MKGGSAPGVGGVGGWEGGQGGIPSVCTFVCWLVFHVILELSTLRRRKSTSVTLPMSVHQCCFQNQWAHVHWPRWIFAVRDWSWNRRYAKI